MSDSRAYTSKVNQDAANYNKRRLSQLGESLFCSLF